MTPQNITLISFGRFEKEFLQSLAEGVVSVYGLQVTIDEKKIDLSQFYEPSRKQYDGNGLLKLIDSAQISTAFKIVGLFRVDLFIPILTYIYGQAFLNGRTAIASLFRLKNERYGMPADERLLLNRFTKEVVHELGHTFGLKHCHTPGCVMSSSTYVEDIDQKSQFLCVHCREEYLNNIAKRKEPL